MLPHHFAHGIGDNTGQGLRQSVDLGIDFSIDAVDLRVDTVDFAVQPVEPCVMFREFLVGFFLESQQVFAQVLYLSGQETEWALQLADAAFEVRNLGFDVNGHGQYVS